jgi:hypothetical protein
MKNLSPIKYLVLFGFSLALLLASPSCTETEDTEVLSGLLTTVYIASSPELNYWHDFIRTNSPYDITSIATPEEFVYTSHLSAFVPNNDVVKKFMIDSGYFKTFTNASGGLDTIIDFTKAKNDINNKINMANVGKFNKNFLQYHYFTKYFVNGELNVDGSGFYTAIDSTIILVENGKLAIDYDTLQPKGNLADMPKIIKIIEEPMNGTIYVIDKMLPFPE